jgi:porin
MRRIDRRRSTRLACATLCLLCAGNQLGTNACAQAQRSDNAQAPGQSHLTGDWDGVRPDLERLGITVTLNYTNDFLANVSGGIKSGTVGIGIFQPQIDLDLQKLLGWQGDQVHIHGLLTHGPFFSAPDIGNLLAVSSLEAGPVTRLYALWYEHNAPEDRWSVRTGLMLADSQFVQSETASNFINNGISWPTFLAANLPASGPAYPLPAPGIRLRVKPSENVAFQAAAFSGDPSGGNGSNKPISLPTGTVFSFNGGAFLIAEASYLPKQDKDTSELAGAYRIGVWYHTSSHFADQRFDNTGLSIANPQSTGIPLEHAGDYGVYGMIDQTLYRVPGTNDQGLSGFVRTGGVPNDRNLINFYADGGLLYKGLVPGRPDDKIGVAAAYARVGDNARGLDADIGLFGRFFYPVRSGETMIEMMYQVQLAKWWTLQPELQYIILPGGGVLNTDGRLRDNAWVIGIRSALKF